MFSMSNEIPAINDNLTQRQLFSVCSKLTGHYPIGGWLDWSVVTLSGMPKSKGEMTLWAV